MNVPRGVLLNNPLNMEQEQILWRGMTTDQPDATFCKFVSPEYGFRAAFIDFRNAQRNHGINTIRALVSRWAPPEDNNDTEAYIKSVCQQTGYTDTQPIDFTDWNQVSGIAMAMTTQEQGGFSGFFTMDQLRDGAMLASVRGVPDHDS